MPSPTPPDLSFDPAHSLRQDPACVTEMATNEQPSGRSLPPSESVAANQVKAKVPLWRKMLGGTKSAQEPPSSRSSVDEDDGHKAKPEKWSMGVLNDKQTDEVPGASRVQCYFVYCTLPVAQQY